jgi:hypothetical protein
MLLPSVSICLCQCAAAATVSCMSHRVRPSSPPPPHQRGLQENSGQLSLTQSSPCLPAFRAWPPGCYPQLLPASHSPEVVLHEMRIMRTDPVLDMMPSKALHTVCPVAHWMPAATLLFFESRVLTCLTLQPPCLASPLAWQLWHDQRQCHNTPHALQKYM